MARTFYPLQRNQCRRLTHSKSVPNIIHDRRGLSHCRKTASRIPFGRSVTGGIRNPPFIFAQRPFHSDNDPHRSFRTSMTIIMHVPPWSFRFNRLSLSLSLNFFLRTGTQLLSRARSRWSVFDYSYGEDMQQLIECLFQCTGSYRYNMFAHASLGACVTVVAERRRVESYMLK